jgi:glycosyltransferase involved in cell wall biosynthesis
MQRIPHVPPVIEPLSDNMSRPVWSVMIPVYNCIDYLRYAIESVLVQDIGADLMQIEVVDDCSTDGDVKSLVESVGEGRVKYFRQAVNVGSLRNFETCINRSRGVYVHLLHGDDLVLPGYYKKMQQLFDLHPKAGAAFSDYIFVNHLGKSLSIVNEKLLPNDGVIPGFLNKIASRQLIQPPAITVKRSTYEKLGSFFAVHFGEDWEMWTRIASQFPIAYSPIPFAAYRVSHGIGISHNSFLTGQNITDISKVIAIIQDYLPPNKRKKLKGAAFDYYAVYSIRVANGMLGTNRKAAIGQVKGALSMSKSVKTLLWTSRFYIMYFIRYKQLANIFSRAESAKAGT